jgi:hypothetical protein
MSELESINKYKKEIDFVYNEEFQTCQIEGDTVINFDVKGETYYKYFNDIKIIPKEKFVLTIEELQINNEYEEDIVIYQRPSNNYSFFDFFLNGEKIDTKQYIYKLKIKITGECKIEQHIQTLVDH